jgi:hypothetical protein
MRVVAIESNWAIVATDSRHFVEWRKFYFRHLQARLTSSSVLLSDMAALTLSSLERKSRARGPAIFFLKNYWGVGGGVDFFGVVVPVVLLWAAVPVVAL